MVHELSPLLVVGASAFIALYAGKLAQLIKLPSIIGYMIVGTILGPSIAGLLSVELQEGLGFVSDIALGFVAISIGLELSITNLKKQGRSIIAIIFAESLLAFIVVTLLLGLVTGNWPFAILFGSIAPASAPAGTVAIIQEYKAKGPLTQALYAVVGFDDGLGIIIYGFASAIAVQMLSTGGFAIANLIAPLIEIVLSLVVGAVIGVIAGVLSARLSSDRDRLVLVFASVLVGAGVSELLDLSLILTNLAVGIVVVNSQPTRVAHKIGDAVQAVMPLLFTLFFLLAGAHLELAALPALGVIGIVYILGRAGGLISGAWLGSVLGRAPTVLKRYLGFGILSQAGVAIGLALHVQRTFTPISPEGAWIGATIITTVTATSIVFEIIGPILTKIVLTRAGEIAQHA